MDRVMAEALRNDRELFELLRLREGWLRAQSEREVKWYQEDEQGSTVVTLTRDDLWLRYQDALARRADAQRAEEVASTTALARTNTRLARQQLWLAIAIAIATVVQAGAAAFTVWGAP
jgi:hypothetical protein